MTLVPADATPAQASESSIPDRFEALVRRSPERVAVSGPSGSLRYGELDRMANGIAHAVLSRTGAGPGPVALLFDHDILAIAAVLGVLKAGKFYVPLDPRFPAARTSLMLEDAGAPVVLTDAERPVVPEAAAVLYARGPEVSTDVSRPDIACAPTDPAYLLYSSGSTGRPKGIVHSHASVLHHVADNTAAYGLLEEDRHALVLSYCFAASVSEIFGALLQGRRLVLFDVKATDLGTLKERLLAESVSVLKLPIALFRLFTASLPDEPGFPDLRRVIVGGDTLFRRDVNRFRGHFAPTCGLVNRLASTETNTIAHVVLEHDTVLEEGVVPVGWPAADKEVRIVGPDGRTLRPGEVGEIVVRSRYLALSYWNDPERTRQAFRPVADDGSRKDYWTGDVGRLREDGRLDHLGREDSQVKIRGYRVELAEVKAALLETDGVEAAEVVVREPLPGRKSLAAYLVSERDLSIPAVRAHVANVLPEYMHPTAWVTLDALPMTPTGKVDVQALPDPEEGRAAQEAAVDGPRDDVEQSLARIWESVLDRRPIGIRESFIDLGGESLAAIDLVTRVGERFGRRVPVTALLEAPTIEQMARLLREDRPQTKDASLVCLKPDGSGAPFFCVPPAATTVLVLSDLARHLRCPVYGLQPAGMDGSSEPHETVEEMAAHYGTAIRTAQPEGPYRLGGLCFGGVVAFEMARRLAAEGEGVAFLGILDTLVPPRIPLRRMSPGIFLARLRELRRRGLLARDLTRRVRRLAGIDEQDAGDPEADGMVRELQTGGRDIDEERILRVWRTHYRARVRYMPDPYSGRISLFWSETRDRPEDRRLEWARFSSQPLDIHTVRGRHVKESSFFRGENARDLAAKLNACLAQADRTLHGDRR